MPLDHSNRYVLGAVFTKGVRLANWPVSPMPSGATGDSGFPRLRSTPLGISARGSNAAQTPQLTKVTTP
jgi:hypothetical protein